MSLSLLTRFGMTRAAGGGGGTEYVGIESIDTSGTQSTSNRVGNAFDIIDGAVSVVALRFRSRNSSATETLRLWRVSDTTEIATGSATSVNDSWVRIDITPIELAIGSYRLMMDSAGSNRITCVETALSLPTDAGVTEGPRISYQGALLASNSSYPSNTPDATRLRGMVDIIYTLV